MQKTFWQKLKSRKLWLALIGAASGIAIAWGVDKTIVEVVAGAAVSLVSVVSYIVVEGKIDAAGVELGAEFVNKVIDAIGVIESNKISDEASE